MIRQKSLQQSIDLFMREDDIERNFLYMSKLPQDQVSCSLKIKSDLVLAGLPFFFEVFSYLMDTPLYYNEAVKEFEGKNFKKEDKKEIIFDLPFAVALTGERLALNLLHRASAIATTTHQVVEKVKGSELKILDTRKTTPGLRFLEKYAVVIGGGYNHRFGQADTWMVKDNHKKFFGGLKEAVEFFKSMRGFYQPIVVEIHDLKELEEAISLGVRHVMLDNFSKNDIEKALKLKKENMTYEVSGGISLDNIKDYIIEGIDAASMSSITANPVKVDLSLKYKRIETHGF